MGEVSKLIWLNGQHLDQAIQMIESIGDAEYCHTDSRLFTSGIGEHVRHVVEHYLMFLNGLSAGSIDYDARERDLRISSQRSFATESIKSLQLQLEAIPCQDSFIRVKMMTSDQDELNTPWSDSSLSRELQYLQAHTIHHYALIAMILRLQNFEPSSEFGVAPSTLKYRQTQFA